MKFFIQLLLLVLVSFNASYSQISSSRSSALKNSSGIIVSEGMHDYIKLSGLANHGVSTKFGRNPDTDSGPEDIWAGGDLYTGQPVSFTPETVTIVSSDVDDTAAGSGARTVVYFGLPSSTSTEYVADTITLNGTTAVTSSGTWWRINRAYVVTAGSTGGNEGTITIASSTTTANVFVVMPTGNNQTLVGAYTVPDSTDILIKRVRTAIVRSTGAAGSATVSLRIREQGGVYRGIRVFEVQTGSPTGFTAIGGIMLGPGTDIKWTIETVSDANTVCEAAFEYLSKRQ